MSRCAAFIPVFRSARGPVPMGSSPSDEIPAARRLTAPRNCTAAMTPKAAIVAAKKTTILTNKPALSFEIALKMLSMASDLEIDHPEHQEIADPHPSRRSRQAHLGEIVLPDAGVEIRRYDLHNN